MKSRRPVQAADTGMVATGQYHAGMERVALPFSTVSGARQQAAVGQRDQAVGVAQVRVEVDFQPGQEGFALAQLPLKGPLPDFRQGNRRGGQQGNRRGRGGGGVWRKGGLHCGKARPEMSVKREYTRVSGHPCSNERRTWHSGLRHDGHVNSGL